MDHMASRMNLNVLVADDSRAVHSVFVEIAAEFSLPIRLFGAENGRECMEALNDGRINVAFIDVNMPDMSGMDAIGESRRTGSKTFVTLMSATANKVRLQLARQLKVYEFLAKPFAAADVHAILQTYCRVTVPTEALVVDDSATVRRIICRVFEESIFSIHSTEAADGEAALALARDRRYDVVFLDCNMPGLNGLETLDRLIERDPSVKVIMISGQHNDERKREALDRGAAAFLYKPFNAADIDHELHAVFGLRVPQLANIAPMKFAHPLPAPALPVEASWR
jgi:CheY-like chemotaxis protein